MAQDIPHHIQRLLTLFMEGNSTLEQEEELASFFRTHQVDEQWKPYQQMFAYFDRGMDGIPAKKKPRWQIAWRAAAAAAVIAVLVAVAVSLHKNQIDNVIPQQPRMAENTQRQSGADEPSSNKTEIISTETTAPAVAKKPLLASNTKKVTKKANLAKASHSKAKDSIEIVHTQAELEVAEQEILADRMLLEEELQQTQRRRHATNAQSGWITTSLNIQ